MKLDYETPPPDRTPNGKWIVKLATAFGAVAGPIVIVLLDAPLFLPVGLVAGLFFGWLVGVLVASWYERSNHRGRDEDEITQ